MVHIGMLLTILSAIMIGAGCWILKEDPAAGTLAIVGGLAYFELFLFGLREIFEMEKLRRHF